MFSSKWLCFSLLFTFFNWLEPLFKLPIKLFRILSNQAFFFHFFESSSCYCCNLLVKLSVLVINCIIKWGTDIKNWEWWWKKEKEYDENEVGIEQPYELKLTKGGDGGTNVDAIAPGGSADKTGKIIVGDKILATRCVVFTFLLNFHDLVLPRSTSGTRWVNDGFYMCIIQSNKQKKWVACGDCQWKFEGAWCCFKKLGRLLPCVSFWWLFSVR